METTSSGNAPESWLLDLIASTRLIHRLLVPLGWMFAKAARVPLRLPSFNRLRVPALQSDKSSRVADIVWAVFVLVATVYIVYRVIMYVRTGVSLR